MQPFFSLQSSRVFNEDFYSYVDSILSSCTRKCLLYFLINLLMNFERDFGHVIEEKNLLPGTWKHFLFNYDNATSIILITPFVFILEDM